MTGPIPRPLDVRSLPANGYEEAIRADEAERAALASANGIEAVELFEATVRAIAWGAEGVRVDGSVRARVVQSCVITLEPVRNEIDEPIDAVFVPEGSAFARGTDDGEIVIDAEGDDAPETFRLPTLDLGAVAAEFFSLALDPYPRRKDAKLPTAATDAPTGAFASLAALKAKDG